MATFYEPKKLLHKALLGTAIMLMEISGVQGATIEVPAGHFDRNGDYVDGAITWKKITPSSEKRSYEKAEKFCSEELEKNVVWHLPTQAQLNAFWYSTRGNKSSKDELMERGWHLDKTWVRDNADSIKYRQHGFVELARGTVVKPSPASEENYVLCVRYPEVSSTGAYFDGKLRWSKVENKKLTYDQAKKHCADHVDKESTAGSWRLPNQEQLIDFFKTTMAQHILDAQGWWTDGYLWSSTSSESASELPSAASLSRFTGRHKIYAELSRDLSEYHVTCVNSQPLLQPLFIPSLKPIALPKEAFRQACKQPPDLNYKKETWVEPGEYCPLNFRDGDMICMNKGGVAGATNISFFKTRDDTTPFSLSPVTPDTLVIFGVGGGYFGFTVDRGLYMWMCTQSRHYPSPY
jgi:hypothetical protein